MLLVLFPPPPSRPSIPFDSIPIGPHKFINYNYIKIWYLRKNLENSLIPTTLAGLLRKLLFVGTFNKFKHV